MFSIEVESGDDGDLLIAELWELGSTGIVEEDGVLRAFFEDDVDSAALVERFGGRIVRHATRDWVAFSRTDWAPLAVGSRFYLVPEWLDDPAPEGRLRIAINPGLACGTGFHEATQLCLEALEEYLRAGMTVLDVGTGSGLLAVAAGMLGARRVIGCDVDPVAVEIAGRAGVCVFNGSADGVRSGSCDLVVANINAAVAIGMAGEFLRCVAPGGRVVVSGFEGHEAESVERAYPGVERRMGKRDWRAVVVTRKD
jgi:ribosomal protein L11 methyltransferase